MKQMSAQEQTASMVMVRFSCEDVLNMLRILDGEPVVNYRDEPKVSEPMSERCDICKKPGCLGQCIG